MANFLYRNAYKAIVPRFYRHVCLAFQNWTRDETISEVWCLLLEISFVRLLINGFTLRFLGKIEAYIPTLLAHSQMNGTHVATFVNF